MGFRSLPISVNMNDLEQRNSLVVRYFTEFDSSGGRLRHSG